MKYAGLLTWNRTTWPRDPEQDGKQVRREVPEGEWVTREVPELRIVPQELWEAVKTRQQQQSRTGSRSAAHWRNRRLLSGLLVCAKCGGSYSLRGKNTYGCSTRQNRGEVVCDCTVTVNAASYGGGVRRSGGTVLVRNSIVAGNRAEFGGSDVYGDFHTSSDYNLIGVIDVCDPDARKAR